MRGVPRGNVDMIVAEGTFPNAELGAVCCLDQFGIAAARHIAGWRKVTEAVQAHNVPITLQLMYGGRVSDRRCLNVGEANLALGPKGISRWRQVQRCADDAALAIACGQFVELPPFRSDMRYSLGRLHKSLGIRLCPTNSSASM